MAKSRPPYSLEFRQQMVELVRSGRRPSELAREFEPSAQAIGTWVRQATEEGDPSSAGLTGDERDKLRRLRQENKRLRTEREILSKAAAWCGALGRPMRRLPTLRVRESTSGLLSSNHALSRIGCLPQRLLDAGRSGDGPYRHRRVLQFQPGICTGGGLRVDHGSGTLSTEYVENGRSGSLCLP